jgi:hypothetical protein
MSGQLPTFKTTSKQEAERFIRTALTRGDMIALIRLHSYPDHHFRAVFDPNFFVLAEDRSKPSKSQWNTLKKRLKRMNKQVFVFKDHGETEDGYFYLDFGFFQD